MCDDKDMQEVKDRCRRIETRLTKYLEQNGFDTQRRMPTLKGNEINLPSLDCSVADILSVIPKGMTETYFVMHKGQNVLIITA